VACEQLRLVLQQPERFAVRKQLTTDLLRAYFKTLWDADNSRGSKLRLEVLKASRTERVARAVSSGAARRHLPAYEPRHPNTVRVRFLNYLESRQWVEAGEVQFLRQEAARRASEHYELTRSELTRGLPSPTLLLSSASSPHFNANYPNYNPSQKSAAGGSPHYSQPYSQDGTARTSPRAGGRDPSRLSVGGGADARV